MTREVIIGLAKVLGHPREINVRVGTLALRFREIAIAANTVGIAWIAIAHLADPLGTLLISSLRAMATVWRPLIIRRIMARGGTNETRRRRAARPSAGLGAEPGPLISVKGRNVGLPSEQPIKTATNAKNLLLQKRETT
jgi:hypothetical protein